MTEQKTPFTIRDCEPDDVETVVGLVRELAAYEKLEEHAKGTPEAFLTHLFGLRPAAEAILAEVEGRAVGIAIFYTTFSTFSYETAALIEQGDWRRSTLYVALSVGLSLAGTFGGMGLAQELISRARGA